MFSHIFIWKSGRMQTFALSCKYNHLNRKACQNNSKCLKPWHELLEIHKSDSNLLWIYWNWCCLGAVKFNTAPEPSPYFFFPPIVRFSLFFFWTCKERIKMSNRNQKGGTIFWAKYSLSEGQTSFMASSICLSSSYLSRDSLRGWTITSSIWGNSWSTWMKRALLCTEINRIDQ